MVKRTCALIYKKWSNLSSENIELTCCNKTTKSKPCLAYRKKEWWPNSIGLWCVAPSGWITTMAPTQNISSAQSGWKDPIFETINVFMVLCHKTSKRMANSKILETIQYDEVQRIMMCASVCVDLFWGLKCWKLSAKLCVCMYRCMLMHMYTYIYIYMIIYVHTNTRC